MQERRILLYLSEEDIPSSAKIPQVGDSCNVVWVPVGLNTGRINLDAYAYKTIYIEQPIQATFPEQANMSSTIYITPQQINYANTMSYSVNIRYLFAGTKSYSNTYAIAVNYGNVYLGYIKLKFSTTLTITSITNPDEYPFYVDTE